MGHNSGPKNTDDCDQVQLFMASASLHSNLSFCIRALTAGTLKGLLSGVNGSEGSSANRESGRVEKTKARERRTGVGGKLRLRRQIDGTKRKEETRRGSGSRSSHSEWRRHSALICFEGEGFSLCASISSLCFPESFTRADRFPFSSQALPHNPTSVCVLVIISHSCTEVCGGGGFPGNVSIHLQTGRIKGNMNCGCRGESEGKQPTRLLPCRSRQASECICWKHKVGRKAATHTINKALGVLLVSNNNLKVTFVKGHVMNHGSLCSKPQLTLLFANCENGVKKVLQVFLQRAAATGSGAPWSSSCIT